MSTNKQVPQNVAKPSGEKDEGGGAEKSQSPEGGGGVPSDSKPNTTNTKPSKLTKPSAAEAPPAVEDGAPSDSKPNTTKSPKLTKPPVTATPAGEKGVSSDSKPNTPKPQKLVKPKTPAAVAPPEGDDNGGSVEKSQSPEDGVPPDSKRNTLKPWKIMKPGGLIKLKPSAAEAPPPPPSGEDDEGGVEMSESPEDGVPSESKPDNNKSPSTADDEPSPQKASRGNCASAACRKIGLLLWKNLLLRKCHYVMTILEIALPVIFTILLCVIFSIENPGSHKPNYSKLNIIEEPEELIQCWVGQWHKSPPAVPLSTCELYYTPDSKDVREVIDKVSLSPGVGWKFKGPESKIRKEVGKYKLKQLLQGNPQAIVIFDEDEKFKSNKAALNYKIRFISPRNQSQKFLSTIQRAVDTAIISKITGAPPKFTYKFHNLLMIDTTKDINPHAAVLRAFNVAFLVGLGFGFIVTVIMQGVVNEKETGIKELLKLSCLPNWMHWTAWTINFVMVFTITVTLVMLVLFNIGISGNRFLWTSDKLLVWTVIWLYVFAATTFCFFLSSFFSKPTIAENVGQLIWLITAVAPALLLRTNYEDVPLPGKLGIALMPNAALYLAFRFILIAEDRGGADWGNSFDTDEDELSLGLVIIMLIVDIVLYFLLTLYFEVVLPSQYGVRRPAYFLFTPSFWGCGKRTGSTAKVGQDTTIDESGEEKPGFEPEVEGVEGLPIGVHIKNMRKTFGKSTAVDGISLKMFEGEIFALLGHNGAGKTTTISCCIGMMAPTSGTAIINNFDIVKEMDQVRQNIGICPQHNLLFDELTVEEHLKFFGKLKGMSSADAKKERSELLEKLQLTQQANIISKKLSGGGKRKLCLGIALIGNAKVIFLDEPTSGMDVEVRRAIWDLLLAERGHRTIVLTTHFMEEADVLGDRIGIMAHGRVQCCGTSTFLKKFYGTGYTLSMTISDQSPKNRVAVLSTVQVLVPTATIVDDPHAPKDQLDINLPTESCPTSTFSKLFKSLQDKKQSFGIKTFGLSLTTMDEVFVKVDEAYSNNTKGGKLELIPIPSNATAMQETDGEQNQSNLENAEANPQPQEESKPSDLDPSNVDVDLPIKVEDTTDGQPSSSQNGKASADVEKEGNDKHIRGCSLISQQFLSLIIKRFHYTRRKGILFIAQLAVPMFIVVLAIIICNSTLSDVSRKVQGPKKIIDPGKIITYFRDHRTDKFTADSIRKIIGKSTQVLDVPGKIEDVLQQKSKDKPELFVHNLLIAFEITSSEIHIYSGPRVKTIAQNMASNILLALTSPSSSSSNVHIAMTQLPPIVELFELDFTKILTKMPFYIVPVVSTLGAFIPLGIAILATSFIVAPIEEKISSSKQLQLMTGLNPAIYWGAYFVWDFIVTVVVICVIVLAFVVCEHKDDHWVGVFTMDGGAGVIFLIMVTFAYAAVPFSYIFSLLISRVGCGFATVAAIHYFTALFGHVSAMAFEGSDTTWKYVAGIVFRVIGSPFPNFGFLMCIEKYFVVALRKSRCMFLPEYVSENKERLLCQDPNLGWATPQFDGHNVDAFQCCDNCRGSPDCVKNLAYITLWTVTPARDAGKDRHVAGLGQELLYLFLLGTIYHVILISWEVVIGPRCRYKVLTSPAGHVQNSDEDVEEEAQRVEQLVNENRQTEDALIIQNLSKNYGTFAAVKDLNFGLHYGECFGLLGVNGAGKTTTFRMLTMDESRTSGNAYASGFELKKSTKPFLKTIGYCPQVDGIVDVLTGLEMVNLFARLRGLKDVTNESKKWMANVGLTEDENVQCGKYSGGMKRRLCAAMALVGDPEIILLDEPTTGVDPVSRRDFWKIILSTKAAGRAIILTSHSMDEITACCTRLAIMVNGQLQCLGGVQYLKNRFAQGFSLDLKLSSIPAGEESANLDLEIKEKFDPCVLKDSHATSMQYHIQDAAIPWDVLFSRMEEIKEKYPNLIKDYSFAETTLEQVFLAFARMQYPSRTVSGGCSSCCCKKSSPNNDIVPP